MASFGNGLHRRMPDLTDLHWPARMHYVAVPSHQEITFLLEGAHNASGMKRACQELRESCLHNGC